MNLFKVLIPCALQRSGESSGEGDSNDDEVSCWFTGRGQNDDSRMTQRMGASASSSLAPIGGDSVQAARLSASGNPDQLSIIVR